MSTNEARKWKNTSHHTAVEQPKKVSVRVKNPSWITKGEKLIYAFVAFAVILAGVFIVSVSSATDTLNRDIQSLETEIQSQRIVNEGLAFEVKELSRPERIIAIANEYGLKIQNAEVKQTQILD